MRKVKFNKWIPGIWGDVYKDVVFQGKGYLEGTNCWETNFIHDGIFHQWANAYTEFESGAGNYTVALVELPDGTILEVLPSNMKFVEPMPLPVNFNKMYKVKINYYGELEDKEIETEMPKIPLIGEMIGFWHGNSWIITTVRSFIHEFEKDGKFLLIEINVSE